MAGWLSTATSVFRRKADEPPQLYRLRCTCGRVLSGERLKSAQTVLCPGCRNSRFVLPASAYPRLKAPAPKKPPQAPTERRGEVNQPTGEARRATTNDDVAENAGVMASEATGRVVTSATEPARHSGRAEKTPIDFQRWRRKMLSPVRLVLAGVLLVTLATLGWLWRLRSLEHARIVLAAAPRAGEEALRDGDPAEAARQFAALRHALDTLGRDDPQARIWRRMSRETAAAADLLHASLHDILHEAVEARSGPSPAVWAELFRGMYRGGWIVIDAPVQRSELAEAQPRFVVDYPLSVGADRGTVVADLKALERVFGQNSGPRRVIFAAQVQDVRPDDGSNHEWRVVLAPDTAFLWTSAETFEMLGLALDHATRQLLEEQAGLAEGES
ncbi:MAG: hypothetical protein ACT4QC_01070 [Planctomycetaceae bacterium]